MKPGVERGFRAEPQDVWNTRLQPAKWATVYSSSVNARFALSHASRARPTCWSANLGFRSAPPQALCYRRASRALLKVATGRSEHCRCGRTGGALFLISNTWTPALTRSHRYRVYPDLGFGHE